MSTTAHSSVQGQWLFPWQYETVTGQPSQWLPALVTAILGVLVIVAFARFSDRVPVKPESNEAGKKDV